MDFYKKVLDSMDRVSDSNERLAEYLDGVLNKKGLESFVSVTPHKDGYRLQIAGKYSPMYADVYLDGEDLVLGGSQIGKLSAKDIKELATFLGIPEKEVGEKADRFASAIRYLIAHNHRPVDELAKVKDDGESDEVAEKVEEVFADFGADESGEPGVRHIDLVAYGTPISLLFRTSDKNPNRLDVYAAVDGDVDVEAERQYVGSDSIANKGRAVVKALMGGILADLAGKAAAKEAEAEKKAAIEAGAFDADVLYVKIKEMHEDLQNLPAGAKQEIMAEVENADHEVKLMFTPGEAEGSVDFIMDVDGKPHQIGEYLISNKMLPYFAVSDLLRQVGSILDIEVADSCGKKKDDVAQGNGNSAFSVEADIVRMLEDFRSGSKDARVLEYDDINGHSVQLTVVPSRGGKQMDIFATIDGAAPSLLTSASTENMLGAARAVVQLYSQLLPVDDSACVKDDEHAAPESALVPLSDAVNAMRNDRSIKTKIANVDYLGSDVSYVLTRKVDTDKGLVHVYVRNGKGTPMKFVASYDLDGIGVAGRMFHAGLKELGIEDACQKTVHDDESKGKDALGVEADIMRMMQDFRSGSKDARVLEYDALEGHNVRLTIIPSQDGKRMDVYATIDGGVPTFLATQLIDAPLASTKVLNSLYDKILPVQEDSKDKKTVCDGTARNLERMQKRVASALAGENGGRAYAMRSYGKDKTLASAAIKVMKEGDNAAGVDVAYIYTTPTIDIVVDEHYDIPAGDVPEKELGAKIDARFDELGKIAVDTYEGKITEDNAKELIGGNVEIEHDVVPSSINMVRDAAYPKEAELVASLEADGSAENVARVAKEWADAFGFKTMKGSDGKELMAFSYVNGESDEKPTQYSYKQRAWTRIA